MTTTYVLTVRPAWVEHVPAGWKELVAADNPQAGYYGHVTYDEPLPFSAADHFSLRPCGPFVVEVHVDGDVLLLSDVFHRWQNTAYLLATGQLTNDEVETRVRARCAEYDLHYGGVVFGYFDPRPGRDTDGGV